MDPWRVGSTWFSGSRVLGCSGSGARVHGFIGSRVVHGFAVSNHVTPSTTKPARRVRRIGARYSRGRPPRGDNSRNDTPSRWPMWQFLRTRVLRCSGAWVLGCSGAQVLRCAGARVLRCLGSGSWVLGFAGSRVVHGFSGSLVRSGGIESGSWLLLKPSAPAFAAARYRPS